MLFFEIPIFQSLYTFIVLIGLGIAVGMYIASQIETHIDNRINPKMKMSKKELGLKKQLWNYQHKYLD